MPFPRLIQLIFILILLVGFALRIYRLDAVDLTGDEAFTAVYGLFTPFTPDWFATMRTEPNPGALAISWALTSVSGDSVFVLRMVSVFGGMIGLASGIALARRLFRDWRLVALVGVLWVLNPFLIYYAQDARQYGLISGLSPLSFYLFLRALDRKTPRAWLIYGVVQTLAIYVHFLDVLWVAAQVLYVLMLAISSRQQFRATLKQPFVTWLLMGIALIPLAIQTYIVVVVSSYRANATLADFPALFTSFLPTLFFGENTLPLFIGVLLAIILFGGVIWWSRKHPREGRLLLLWILVPTVLFFILTTQASLFRPRYVIALVPPLLLTLGALADVSQRFKQRAVIAILVIVGIVSAFGVRDYYFYDTPKGADWRGLTSYLSARATPADTAIFAYSDPAINYYYHGNVTFVPAGTPDIPQLMDALLSTNTALYLLPGEGMTTAQLYLQSAAQWIPNETDHNVTQYRSWLVDEREIQVPLAINFGDIGLLRGYTLVQGAEGGATLLLYWEALAQTTDEHSIMLHLQPSDALPVVLDHGVANSQISTRAWQVGSLYRDPVAIPLETSAGDYTMYVGMYPLGTTDLLPPGRNAVAEISLVAP